MDQKVVDFLTSERVSSLAVVMPDGTSHGATMHYCFDPAKNAVYFLTEASCEKCKAVAGGRIALASVVVGFDEKDNKVTIQLDGQLTWETSTEELVQIKQVYFTKFPDTKKYDTPDSAYLVFKIIKWKYSDYRVHPELVLTG
ncbi:MAG: hypothetical protein AAB887_02365 [Patescibacteria group bacterium]